MSAIEMHANMLIICDRPPNCRTIVVLETLAFIGQEPKKADVKLASDYASTSLEVSRS